MYKNISCIFIRSYITVYIFIIYTLEIKYYTFCHSMISYDNNSYRMSEMYVTL